MVDFPLPCLITDFRRVPRCTISWLLLHISSIMDRSRSWNASGSTAFGPSLNSEKGRSDEPFESWESWESLAPVVFHWVWELGMLTTKKTTNMRAFLSLGQGPWVLIDQKRSDCWTLGLYPEDALSSLSLKGMLISIILGKNLGDS